jgi:predicted transcriptional regulator
MDQVQTAPVLDRTSVLQQAFLLSQIVAAGEEGESRGKLNEKIGAVAGRQLELPAAVANKVRGELVERGYLATRKTGRQVFYVLTDAGRAYFATLEKPTFAERPDRTVVDESGISDELRDAQGAFLLLQLLDAQGRTLAKGQANRIPSALQSSLGLKPAVANHRRARLAEQGYIRIKRNGRNDEYVLTDDGFDYLVACGKHLGHATFTIHGATLNVLVAAARESSFERDKSGSPSAEPSVANAQELAEAVLAEFQDLRREKHGRSGLVPIHEVRGRIADGFGQNAARHDVLDDIILDLWRQGRLRLTAISDLRDASEQELDDSIQGESQTFFYLETVHGQPVVL